MDNKELQDDEREALKSIYEGDDAFKQISAETYQYKVLFSYISFTGNYFMPYFALVWKR